MAEVCSGIQVELDSVETVKKSLIIVAHVLSLALANFKTGSFGLWDAEHRVILDDLMIVLNHEFHGTEGSECG